MGSRGGTSAGVDRPAFARLWVVEFVIHSEQRRFAPAPLPDQATNARWPALGHQHPVSQGAAHPYVPLLALPKPSRKGQVEGCRAWGPRCPPTLAAGVKAAPGAAPNSSLSLRTWWLRASFSVCFYESLSLFLPTGREGIPDCTTREGSPGDILSPLRAAACSLCLRLC